MAKTKYGYITCPAPGCGTRIVVKANDKGTLSAGCDECDFSFYVQKGQAGYSKWDAKIEKAPAAKEPPAPAPKKEDAPKREEKPAPNPEPKPAAARADW